MTSETKNETRAGKWKRIIAHELFEYFLNFVFLSFFLVAFAWYRRLILDSYHIEYLGYWLPLFEAAILAKVIMIGDAMRFSRRFREFPLIVPTIYRTLAYSLFVVLFSVLEHVIGALIHGKRPSSGIAEITSKGWYNLLAWYVLIIVAFLPFFTIKEIGRVLGQEKIRKMFFGIHREEANHSASSQKETGGPKP